MRHTFFSTVGILSLSIFSCCAFATNTSTQITIKEIVGGIVTLPNDMTFDLGKLQNLTQIHSSITSTPIEESITSNYSTSTNIKIEISDPTVASAYGGDELPYMTTPSGTDHKDRIYFELEYKPCGESQYQNMMGTYTGGKFVYDLNSNQTTNCTGGNQGSFEIVTTAVPSNDDVPASGNYDDDLTMTLGST